MDEGTVREEQENASDLDDDDLAPPPAGNTEGDSLKLSKEETRAARGSSC